MTIISEDRDENDRQRGRNGRQREREQRIDKDWMVASSDEEGRVINDDEGEDKDRVIENSHYR